MSADEFVRSPRVPETGGIVTPSDTDELPQIAELWVGTAGDVAVVLAGGAHVTFANAPVGRLEDVRVRQVLATGTTAANLRWLA